MNTMCRMSFQLFAAAAALGTSAFAGAQPSYPQKPIRVIVPYAPGGTTDTVARLLGPKLSDSLGQPLVIDNRPGGNTLIGTEALAKSPPDGYTIMVMVVAHVIIPNLIPTPYDAIKDFAPVTTLSESEQLLVVHRSLPVSTLQELVALAKAKPGELNYGSAGSGGLTHLASELFNSLAGIKTVHIPYKGAGPAITELLGGQIQMYFATPISVMPHVKSGRLKAIAITGGKRSATLPQVPTFAEAKLPAFDVKNWQGVLAPAGTPSALVARLSSEIGRAMKSPDVRDKLVSQGLEPLVMTPEAFGELMRADMAKYADIIRKQHIKLER
jgi:tripartite-type tricarboxylate transporter receptor subunit TctC